MKSFGRFLRTYSLFSFAVVFGAIALALDLTNHDMYAHWTLIGVCVIALIPLVIDMYHDLRHGIYGVDILAAAAIVSALLFHEYWTALVIVLMLTGGKALEDYAERRSKRELDALLSRAPIQARLVKSRDKTVEIPVHEVKAGDKLEIRPGEVVPVDAVILEGEASLDESSLTGESLPQAKAPEDNIVSGSINIDGVLIVRATHSEADSQYQQIIRLVQAATASQAPFVRLADRYAVPFTIIAFAIAGGAWALSGDSLRFLQVLVVATPCPLILAAPIAFMSGMSRAAKHGIIVRTGSALERLAEAKTIAFDKTGTLTEGIPTVETIKTYNGYTKNEVLSFAASVEQNSNHVLARAIVAYAAEARLRPAKTKGVKELAGRGLSATVSGKTVRAGRLQYLLDHDIDVPAKVAAQNTAVYLAINNELAGVISFTDHVRQESKATIARLKRLGFKHILMVTGDSTKTAQRVAKELDIPDVTAEALPGDKLLAIEKLPHRPVAFVGDGVNDAPVLTAADVGIALGARGSTAASESADMVIMLDDLSRVSQAVDISKRTLRIAKQSIFVGIWLSIVLMGAFSTGKFQPIYGALIQEVVDVIVILNALRAHGSFRKTAAEEI